MDSSLAARDHLPLTPAVFHILLALADGAKHGYAVIVDVRERTAGEVRLGTGTLYTAIKRLLERGVIADTDAPAGAGDEERRRYYRLTELGRAVVVAEAERLERLVGIARERDVLAAGRRPR